MKTKIIFFSILLSIHSFNAFSSQTTNEDFLEDDSLKIVKQAVQPYNIDINVDNNVQNSNHTPFSYAFTVLPSDVIEVICKLLSVRDLMHMEITCTALNEIATNDRMWMGRIPGAKTKQDVVSPVVAYNGSFFSISPEDLFPIAKSRKICFNNSLHYLNLKETYFSSKATFFDILIDVDLVYNKDVCLSKRNDGKAALNYIDSRGCDRTVYFEEAKDIDVSFLNLVAPGNLDNNVTDDQKARFFLNKLHILNDHHDFLYTRGTSSGYWGYNNAFNALKELLDELPRFSGANDELKYEISQFFNDRYNAFRLVNQSPYGDGYYADKFLRELKRTIKSSFGEIFIL